jgi:hypothetical protein
VCLYISVIHSVRKHVPNIGRFIFMRNLGRVMDLENSLIEVYTGTSRNVLSVNKYDPGASTCFKRKDEQLGTTSADEKSSRCDMKTPQRTPILWQCIFIALWIHTIG